MAFELTITSLSEFITFVKIIKGLDPDELEIQQLTETLKQSTTTLEEAVDANKEKTQDG